MLIQHFRMEAGMARKTGRAPLVLSIDQRTMLEELAGSRTAPLREVERAKVLLAYAQGNALRRYGACSACRARRSTSASTRRWLPA